MSAGATTVTTNRTMSAPPQIPPPDHHRYRWQADSETGLYSREAGGGEIVCDIQNRAGHGELTLFAGVECSFVRDGLSTESLMEGLHRVWTIARFEVPTIAAEVTHDDCGTAMLNYQTLSTQIQADEWARRTIVVRGNIGLDELREELSATTLPTANRDHVLLYVVLHENTFDLLLHSHHALIDGVGSKLLFTFLLKRLVQFLDGSLEPSPLSLQWGTEGAKLCPCAYDHAALCDGEIKEGPEYQRTLREALESMTIPASRQVVFPSRQHGVDRTGRVEFALTEGETANILQLCRQQAFTVNALVHAALVFAVSPQVSTPECSTSDPLFVFTHLANARFRLSPELSATVGFTGYCLTFTAIAIPFSAVPTTAGPQECAPEWIHEVATLIGVEYARQKAYPSLLAVAAHMVEYYKAGAASRSGSPPPKFSPGYTGDGIAETHLAPEYPDSHGNTFLQVDRTLTSVQTNEPGPTFRAWSWRNRLILSVDYSKVSWSDEEMRSLMATWAAFLRRSVMAH
ncbi:hypothetical protein BV22DRAFT_1034076 [Leucogyrophana mollusca]|uniref:Uncharacterized protein n=1 Tax=Leucogyrophana mollusca TaxID=85980 RepID=A0ACB8BJE5_9AGAM|nr:hypothetical protein BV22DRAFT_1034076 [Leucogyrophana mollusca]